MTGCLISQVQTTLTTTTLLFTMSFSRVDDDGALYIPQNIPANPEPLQTPLTWEPKSLSGKILTARKLLKNFPSSNANTSIRAVNKLSFLEGTIAEPVHKNEFVVITGPKDAGYVSLLAPFIHVRSYID